MTEILLGALVLVVLVCSGVLLHQIRGVAGKGVAEGQATRSHLVGEMERIVNREVVGLRLLSEQQEVAIQTLREQQAADFQALYERQGVEMRALVEELKPPPPPPPPPAPAIKFHHGTFGPPGEPERTNKMLRFIARCTEEGCKHVEVTERPEGGDT